MDGIGGQLKVHPTHGIFTGTNTTAGRLTFDSGLLVEQASFRAEVIVHELLHMKVPNHGKLFKALLGSYNAAYKGGD